MENLALYYLHLLKGAEAEIEFGLKYLESLGKVFPKDSGISFTDALLHKLGLALKNQDSTEINKIEAHVDKLLKELI